jgi:RimJ/RimL family protein N-acetyltransferase
MIASLLQGPRVRLGAFQEADYALLARWQQDTAYLRLLDARPAVPPTPNAVQDEIEELQKSQRSYAFGVRLLDTDALIGYVEIDGILWAHRVGGLGIGIGDPALRGQGYGTEAAELALAFAFRELNLHRITVTIFSYNAASLRMFDKLGFTREGAYREFMERDGQRYDMLLFGLLRREWEARQS